MKAVVYHGVGDIRLDKYPEPKLKKRWIKVMLEPAAAPSVAA